MRRGGRGRIGKGLGGRGLGFLFREDGGECLALCFFFKGVFEGGLGGGELSSPRVNPKHSHQINKHLSRKTSFPLSPLSSTLPPHPPLSPHPNPNQPPKKKKKATRKPHIPSPPPSTPSLTLLPHSRNFACAPRSCAKEFVRFVTSCVSWVLICDSCAVGIVARSTGFWGFRLAGVGGGRGKCGKRGGEKRGGERRAYWVGVRGLAGWGWKTFFGGGWRSGGAGIFRLGSLACLARLFFRRTLV